MKKSEKFDGKPHNLRRKKLPNGRYNSAYPEAWFYNDEKGLTLCVGGYLADIPWRVIQQAARRVGKNLVEVVP